MANSDPANAGLTNSDRALIYRLLAQGEESLGAGQALFEAVQALSEKIDTYQQRNMEMAVNLQEDLDELVSNVAAETDAVTAITMGFDGLAAKFDEIVAQLPTGQQKVQLQQAVATVKANMQALAEATLRDTRADPNAPPEPAPEPTPEPTPTP